MRVRAGASTRMTIGVPSSAIAMLKQGGRGTARLVIEPVSYSGASTFKLTVRGIRAVRR